MHKAMMMREPKMYIQKCDEQHAKCGQTSAIYLENTEVDKETNVKFN